jgi:hypothetical protein
VTLEGRIALPLLRAVGGKRRATDQRLADIVTQRRAKDHTALMLK